MGMLNALYLGDVLFELGYQIRPYEVHPGDTDRVACRVGRRARRLPRDPPSLRVDGRRPVVARRSVEGHAADPTLGRHPRQDRLASLLAGIEGRPGPSAGPLRRHRSGPDARQARASRSPASSFPPSPRATRTTACSVSSSARARRSSLDSISGLVLYWLNQARMNNRAQARHCGLRKGVS